MGNFEEWERFMEFLDSSRTYEQAMKKYRADRRERIKGDNQRELKQLAKDNARDGELEKRILEKRCG